MSCKDGGLSEEMLLLLFQYNDSNDEDLVSDDPPDVIPLLPLSSVCPVIDVPRPLCVCVSAQLVAISRLSFVSFFFFVLVNFLIICRWPHITIN